MFSSTQRKLTATAAAIVLVAGGGAVAASALAGDADPAEDITAVVAAGNALTATGETPRVHLAPASAPPAYSALAKSKQRPTERTQYMAKVLTERFPDLDVTSAKGLKAADGTQAWVISGKSHVCLGAENSDGTGYTCTTNAEAARAPLSIVEARKDDSLRSVLLVPDNVDSITAAGARTAASNNLVVVEYQPEDSVKAVFDDGQKAQLALQ